MNQLPEVSNERVAEMYAAFAKLGTISKPSREFVSGPVSGYMTEMKLPLTIAEALVGLRVARTTEEGEVFVQHVIAGAVTHAVKEGDGNQLLYDLVKTGFAVGLMAQAPKVEGIV